MQKESREKFKKVGGREEERWAEEVKKKDVAR